MTRQEFERRVLGHRITSIVWDDDEINRTERYIELGEPIPEDGGLLLTALVLDDGQRIELSTGSLVDAVWIEAELEP
jgi:hypothetical protein